MAHGHDFKIQPDGLLKIVVNCNDGYSMGVAVTEVGGTLTPVMVLLKPEPDEPKVVAAVAFAGVAEVEMMRMVLGELRKTMEEIDGVKTQTIVVLGKEAEDGRGH